MIGLYDFFVFECPSERYKKWQLHMNTLYIWKDCIEVVVYFSAGKYVNSELDTDNNL